MHGATVGSRDETSARLSPCRPQRPPGRSRRSSPSRGRTASGRTTSGCFSGSSSTTSSGSGPCPSAGCSGPRSGRLVAGPLCYLLLFRVPAEWGRRTGRPFHELAESSFGVGGARWVPGLLIGLAEVVWFSVAVSYATDFALRGLAEVRFLDERTFRTTSLGGLRLKGPLFLATSLFWSVFVGLIGRRFVRLVGGDHVRLPGLPRNAARRVDVRDARRAPDVCPDGDRPDGPGRPRGEGRGLVDDAGRPAHPGVLRDGRGARGRLGRGVDLAARRPRRRLGLGRAGAGGDRDDQPRRRRRLPGAG